MDVVNQDNEIVLHCATCGSSFFDKDGIKNITRNSAQKLAEDAQGHYVLGNKKLCPKDHGELIQKTNDPLIPKNTVLLECPTCEGLFAYPDDLLKYKGVRDPQPLSAVSLKLLPAPKTIFMLSFFAVMSLAVLMNFGAISQNFSTSSRADEMINKVVMATDEKKHYLYFDFITETKTISKVRFLDKTTNTEILKNVSLEPKTVHHLITTDVDLSHDVYYQILLGKDERPTEEKRLEAVR